VIAAYQADGLSASSSRFAREVVSLCHPAGSCRARTLLWTCSRLCQFGLSVGLDPVPEVLLREAVIERFVSVGLSRMSESTRRSVRANLRFVARTVVPGITPAAPVRISRSPLKAPYSRAEVAAMFSLAHHQPTRARQMRLVGLLCLGLGAGLSGSDLRHVTGQHVREDRAGVVVVVEGVRARSVPVLVRYRTPLLESARFAGSCYVTGGARPDRRNLTARLVGVLAGGTDVVRIDPSRLRVTWLVEVSEMLGLRALLCCAGITSSGRLGAIASHCCELGHEQALLLLGGGS
jgi:integrase